MGPYGGGARARGYRYSGSYRRRYRRGGIPTPARNVVWLIVGVVTLGLLFPIPAVISWVRAFRYRAPSLLRAPALAWFVWAVVFSVLSIGTYTTYIVIGATQGSQSGAPSDLYVPPKTTTVAFGSTVHLVADAAAPEGLHSAPVTITLSDLVHRSHSGVRDVNLTTALRVCATSAKVDPLSVAVGINLVTGDGDQIVPAVDWPLPNAFYSPLAANQCAAGTIGYKLPAGATIQSFEYEGNAGRNIVWKAPAP